MKQSICSYIDSHWNLIPIPDLNEYIIDIYCFDRNKDEKFNDILIYTSNFTLYHYQIFENKIIKEIKFVNFIHITRMNHCYYSSNNVLWLYIPFQKHQMEFEFNYKIKQISTKFSKEKIEKIYVLLENGEFYRINSLNELEIRYYNIILFDSFSKYKVLLNFEKELIFKLIKENDFKFKIKIKEFPEKIIHCNAYLILIYLNNIIEKIDSSQKIEKIYDRFL